MNKVFAIVLAICFVAIPGVCLANSAPVVSNVVASQRADNSKLVDIYYDLADADGDNCTIFVYISADNGATWNVRAFSFTGDVGASVAPGSHKHVIWDAGRDAPGLIRTLRARVFADDGKGADDMVMVSAGYYPEDGGANLVFVDNFQIDRYETTIKKYVEFLNAADANGAHYHGEMSGIGIMQTGSPGSYTYSITSSERENYPVQYVTFDDASAFAQWKTNVIGLNYSIPTKYQWQKAAAWDPVENKFYTYGFHSDSIDSTWANYNNNVGHTTPVGYYNGTGGRNDAKSYYGCYDMTGNIWELTTEQGCGGGGTFCVYSVSYITSIEDPTTILSWYFAPWFGPNNEIGFRLVREPNL
jgi:formylglycine-generating enzyme required for sulfatase activity